ncbi:hypothetical protein ACJ41O_006868 [Fusarium nematophilum]
MSESGIRKACDRCHAQKLSCKRLNDEPCERCARLKTECRSSPSLRYRKKKQQQEMQSQDQQLDSSNDHPQPQHLPTASSAPNERRSPKRRRTSRGDPSLVPPDAGRGHVSVSLASNHRPPTTDSHPSLKAVSIVPHSSGLASESHLPVTPDPVVLDAGDFSFTFDQLAFFEQPQQPEQQQQQHLSHPGLPGGCLDPRLHPPPAVFADSWDPRLYSSSSASIEAYHPPPVSVPDHHHHHPPPLLADVAHHADAVPPERPLRSSGCVPEHSSSDKHSRPRTKQRPRQISLRHNNLGVDDTPLLLNHHHQEAPPIYWMAQLSDINARLLDLAAALPPPGEAARDGPSLGKPSDERFRAQGFPIEEMFKLTRRVADILDKPLSSTPERDGVGATIDGSDPGNAMLVLSTYVRLLDMYQRVFALVHAEVSHADPSTTMFNFWKLPDVTVGSFAVDSSPFLQMSLTIQLAEEFLSRLRDSTAARWSSSGTSMFAGVVDVSFQAFWDREEAMAKHLVELRGEIERLLDS